MQLSNTRAILESSPLSRERIAELHAARVARGIAREELAQSETETDHDYLTRVGWSLLAPIYDVALGAAVGAAIASYPAIDPNEIAERTLDSIGRGMARGDTTRYRNHVRRLTHYREHAAAYRRTMISSCERCERCERQLCALVRLVARSVGSKVPTGRGSMPYLDGFERQESTPNYNAFVGESGETVPNAANRVHYVGVAQSHRGRPDVDMFRPAGWLETVMVGMGADDLHNLMLESSYRPDSIYVNWSDVANQLGQSWHKVQNNVRAIYAHAETILVDSPHGWTAVPTRSTK